MSPLPPRSSPRRTGCGRAVSRLAIPVAITAWAALAPVHAQETPGNSAPSAGTAKPGSEKPPYEDRVIDGMQSSQAEESPIAEYNTQGWPRGISLQLTRNMQTTQNVSSRGDTRMDTTGVQIDAYLETPNFGALSIHALSLGGRSTSGLTSWSVRQIGLPFDGGWRADNALGTTNLLVPDLSRRNSRLTLPTPQVLGASTVWRNEGRESVIIGASTGEPGRFEGFPQSRFVGLGGRVNSVFAQVSDGGWAAAAAVAQGNNVLPEVATTTGDNTNGGAPRISPRAIYVSTAYDDVKSGTSWQASAIGSETAGATAAGAWADVTWRDGRQTHQASIFRFNRDLSWIDRPLAADLEGGAYRYDYRSLRWDITANIESFTSVSGQSPSGWYASSSGRWLLNAALSTGGGLAVRNFGVTGGSGFAYLQWQNSLGVSRVQVDASTTQRDESRQAVTLDHSIVVENGLTLSTSLSAERLQPANIVSPGNSTPRQLENAFALGVNGYVPLTERLSLQGSLRARNVTGTGSASGTAISANVSIDWQINRDWSVGASLYENRGILIDTVAVQSPLVTPEIVRTRPNDRGVFVTLRYASRAGSPSMPLGGAPGSGSGRIEGSVFLDANGNGQRDANESGAANILVVLDGRYTTRTNAFGAFEFPNVVSGPHVLTVLQDDLPLPWTVDTEQKIMAPVSTRNITRVDIGAKRMR